MADHRKTDAAAAKGFPAQILPESAIELHMLLENIPGGVCLLEIGPQIRIIYASSGFFRMIGSAENEFVLPCALEALRIHPDYLAEYENALRQGAQDGEMPAQAHRLQSAAGGWIWRRAQAVRTDCACSPYPVMLELSSDISETVALEESLAESQAHLLAVLDQNPHPLWQVDIAKRSVRIYNAVSQSAIPEREFKNFPETLISRGIVHSDSAENFRKFAADLLAGKKEDSGSFIMLNSLNHCYSWFSLSYRMTFDRENNPIRAVGVLEQLPDTSCLSSGYYRRSLPEIVRHHLLARMRVNLTADRTEEFWLNGTDQTSLVQGRSCSELIQFEKKQYLPTEGRCSSISQRRWGMYLENPSSSAPGTQSLLYSFPTRSWRFSWAGAPGSAPRFSGAIPSRSALGIPGRTVYFLPGIWCGRPSPSCAVRMYRISPASGPHFWRSMPCIGILPKHGRPLWPIFTQGRYAGWQPGRR